ncbi:MAG: SufE family protein [Mesorhizobium sp.]
MPYMPGMTSNDTSPAIDRIIEDFDLLDEWEDRYRYVIDLGRDLPPFPDASRTAANKVQGCVSQVWLDTSQGSETDPVMTYQGDSDAHIVRGLVAIMIALYSGRRASEIASTDAEALLKRLGLDEHLSPQRSNGLRAMVQRIRRDAAAALAK